MKAMTLVVALTAVLLQGCGFMGKIAETICKQKSGQLLQEMKDTVHAGLASACDGTTGSTSVNGMTCQDATEKALKKADANATAFADQKTQECMDKFSNVTDLAQLKDLVTDFFNNAKGQFNATGQSLLDQANDKLDSVTASNRLYDAHISVAAVDKSSHGAIVGLAALTALSALLSLGVMRLTRRPSGPVAQPLSEESEESS